MPFGNYFHVPIEYVRHMKYMKGDVLTKKQSMECPVCKNEMIRKKIPYFEEETGLSLGNDILLDADVCMKCGETFFTEESSKRLDLIFMDIGVWGIPCPPPTVVDSVVGDTLLTDFFTLNYIDHPITLSTQR